MHFVASLEGNLCAFHEETDRMREEEHRKGDLVALLLPELDVDPEVHQQSCTSRARQ